MSSIVLHVDFPSFRKYALPIAMEGFPVMLRGDHGIGKSQGVYQLVEDLAWDPDEQRVLLRSDADMSRCVEYSVVERRVSQMTEGDLLGIPDPEGFDINGKSASKFRPFTWLVKACTEPVILFLDELDRGIAEVRQGFFELADSRKIAGWELHPGTVIFSAINGGGENAHRYQVNELGLAEADRWATFDLRPTIEDWLNWGKREKNGEQNIHPMILEFIKTNNQHLEHNDDVEPGKIYPSRRSWTRLNKCLTSRNLLVEGEIDDRAIRFISNAFVGIEAAGIFADFCRTYESQVSPQDILNGDYEKTDNWTLNQQLALADKFERNGIFNEPIEGEAMKNFAAWFIRVPAEVGVKLFHALANGPNDNTINLHGMVVDGVSVNDHLCELLTGTDSNH